MQLINMIMIYYLDKHNGNNPVKNASFEPETSNQCFFSYCYGISFQDMQLFVRFLFQKYIIITWMSCICFETVFNDLVSK